MKLQSSTAVILLLCSNLFLRCAKDSNPSSGEEKLINKEIISQIMNLPENDQRTAFRLLNNDEMAYLWHSKLNAVKLNETMSAEQSAFINELINIITPDLFLINSQSHIEFKTKLGKNIARKARLLFGDENAGKLLASAGHYKGGNVTPNYVDPGEGGVNKCKCSTESNYCDPLAPCDEKPETVCKHTTLGCGTLLIYSCDGMCRPV